MKRSGRADGLQTGRSWFAFFIPILASAVFQQLYSLVNAGVVGRYRGPEEVAVIGACSVLLTLQHFLFNGMSTGFGIVLCRSAEDPEQGAAVFREAVRLTVLLGVLAAALIPAAPLILDFLRVPEELRPAAAGYTAWILAGSGFSAMKNLLIWSLQRQKRTAVTGAVGAVSVVTQTGFTVLLIGVLHLPVWAGAAATLINHLLTGLVLAAFLRRAPGNRPGGRTSAAPPAEADAALFRESISPRTSDGSPAARQTARGIRRDLLAGGAAKSGMMALVAVGGLVFQRRLNGFGVNAIAGYTYAAAVSNVLQVIVGAYGTAAAILCGGWYGRKMFAALSAEIRRLLRRSVCAALLCSLGAALFAGPLIRRMAGEMPEEILAAGSRYLAVSSAGLVFLAVYLVGRYALQAAGNNRSQIILGFLEMLAAVGVTELAAACGSFPLLAAKSVISWGVSAAAAAWMLRGLRKRGRDGRPDGDRTGAEEEQTGTH